MTIAAGVGMGPYNKGNKSSEVSRGSSCVSPSIMIQRLCRDPHYSAVSREECTEALESFGFECMRPYRNPNSKYSEVWLLRGMWAAEGALKELLKILHVDCSSEMGKEQMDHVLQFIFEYAPYGIGCVSVCHVCMDDSV